MQTVYCKLINIIIIILALIFSQGLYAEDNITGKTGEEDAQENTIENGIIPGMISIFPGVFIHGSGHFAAGDRETAKDLLLMEGIGLLSFISAGALLAYSGASRKIVGPALPIITGGAGLFLLSWFSDVYGSFCGPRKAGRYQKEKGIDINAGITHVEDPQFEYSNFAAVSIDASYRAWQVSPAAWIALDDDNERYVIEWSYQLTGKYGHLFKSQCEKMDLRFLNRYGYHKFGTEKFEKKWFDISLTGRFHMGNIWKSLNGSFSLLEAGYNAEWVTFLIGRDIPAEYTYQYLFLVGFGIYFGEASAPKGEMCFYYNHRRDDFVGGLPQGFTGYLGCKGEILILSKIKASLIIEYGSATIVGCQAGIMF